MADKLLRTGAILGVLAIIVFAASYILNSRQRSYLIETRVAGVPVKSQVPLAQVASWKDLRLYDSPDPAIVSCNLMLTSISQGTTYGLYSIDLAEGPKGMEIQSRKAVLRGKDASEISQSCNAFACLMGGVECPDNLFYVRGLVDTADALRIVIDENGSVTSVSAYTELLGALSFAQAKRADADGNGVVEDWELARNKLVIIPYFNRNGTCRAQPLTNLMQNTSGSNESISCSLVRGIHIKEGGENSIVVTDDDRIILSGNETKLLVEGIIVGNVISPDWISALRAIH